MCTEQFDDDLSTSSKRTQIRLYHDSLRQLHAFRVREYLISLLAELGEDPGEWRQVIERSVSFALDLLKVKEHVRATLYEVALVSFWVCMKEAGIGRVSLAKLIEISKLRLKKRIVCKRLLKLLSIVRSVRYSPLDVENEVVFLVRTAVNSILARPEIRSKFSSEKDILVYRYALMEELTKLMDKLMERLNLSGMTKRVLAACCLYIADKLACQKLNRPPVITSRVAAEALGVNQFTVLRRYREIEDALGLFVCAIQQRPRRRSD